jgi:ArsR family transcriptional regulator
MSAAAATESTRLLRALAHPTRLMILKELANGTKCVNDIRELVGIPQPNVSQHLALLKESGLVTSHKQGVRRCYSLANPALIEGLLSTLGPERAAATRRNPASARSGGGKSSGAE